MLRLELDISFRTFIGAEGWVLLLFLYENLLFSSEFSSFSHLSVSPMRLDVLCFVSFDDFDDETSIEVVELVIEEDAVRDEDAVLLK